jgi:predicted nucleic acid-binding protein
VTAPVFVDTNVFVYARDTTERDKHESAVRWLELLWRRRLGRTSYQVLNEYYVTVTMKLDRRLSACRAREDLRDLMNWDPITFSEPLMADAWTVQDRYGFSWWDALIVAAARSSGSRYLLTEDLQSAQQIDELEVVSPFATDPGSILA